MAAKRRKKKQKYRLKEEAKRFLVYFGVSALILLYAIVKCNDLIKEYKYQQTHEYKLLELGYTKDETSNLLNSINSKYLDAILAEEETNTFYTSLVSNQYYIKENYEEYLNYYEYHQTTDPKEIIGIINSKANLEWYSKIEKANYDTAPILVNKYYYIDETYEIKNLVNINLQSSYANNKAEEETVNAYYELWTAAKNELGVNLMVSSSYRSFETQTNRYAEFKKVSLEYADTFCARSGHSEHQTGLALDIVSTRNSTRTKFIQSEEYEWLKNNAHKYGFIIRYPDEKFNITGFKDEENHIRYVGPIVAAKIYNENITLEEYYAFYIAK